MLKMNMLLKATGYGNWFNCVDVANQVGLANIYEKTQIKSWIQKKFTFFDNIMKIPSRLQLPEGIQFSKEKNVIVI